MLRQISREVLDGLAYFIIIMVAVSMAGCAGMQGNPIPETPKGQYVTARKFYNDTLESLVVYGALMTAEQKTELKTELDPILDTAETTLDGWKLALMDPTKDAAAYNTAWLKLRQKMVVTIAKYLNDD